eukprot:TRINITY_DN9279_c0_g1_i1.p1 TRINITY_DN9279_c0_g1~~TRINITY_DN9279_c0_g1_i1.p1  ORF type:complete len:279 (+),score=35.51 TRINITY_DN9279_c0_g1_i1:105-941(+)
MNVTNETCSFSNGTRSHLIANFYLLSMWSVGGSLYFLVEIMKKSGVTNKFFLLPSISLICALAFIFIDLNLFFITDICDDLRNGLEVTQYVLDSLTTISLELAYFFRLRVVINSAKRTGAVSPVLDYLSYLLLFVPATWVVCDILTIVALFNEDLKKKADGKFSQYIFGSWNLALAINDLIMHFGFMIFVLKLTSTATLKMRNKLILVATLLSFNSFGVMIGSIWNFINPDVGRVLIYSFWLSNTFVFLFLNKTVGNVTKHGAKSAQKLNQQQQYERF